ncbi:MAG TPA: hypothetical protein VHQ94_12825 [Pyrinomonadaceae bacterium]|jgi:hypothetical protein|nr:hypothetical protein [Pyrinomonadaceae bacterium]
MNNRRFDDETLTSSLQLLAEEMESLNAPPEIEQKLREAFRAQTATAASHSYGRYWLVAVAAMILIVISVIALRSRNEPPKPTIAQQPQIKEQPTIVEQPRVDQLQPKQQQIAQKPRRPAARRSQNNEVANHVNREIATDFMPLGYFNASTLQDGGQIVRVELPRSTLMSFGLPVNMDRYHEKVKADVFIGVDGLAHAIRFVR